MSQLCTSAQSKIDSIKKPHSVKQIGPFLTKTIAVAKPYVNKLESANPPAKLQPEFQQVVSLNHRELGLVTQAKKALQKGAKPQLVVAAFQQKANSLSQQENAKWRQLGVPKCAS